MTGIHSDKAPQYIGQEAGLNYTAPLRLDPSHQRIIAMYERFTDKARKVMQLAKQEAEQRNHEWLDTEHILFALVTDGSGVAAHVLNALGIDLLRVQERIVSNLEPRSTGVPTVRPPLTGAAKKAIEYSMKEARDLSHNYVSTEHILLGLLRERDAVAAQVLKDMGVLIDDVRKETLNVLGHKEVPSPCPPDYDRAMDELQLSRRPLTWFAVILRVTAVGVIAAMIVWLIVEAKKANREDAERAKERAAKIQRSSAPDAP